MTDEIAIEVEKDQAKAYETEAAAEGLELESFELKRFDGGVAIAAIVTPFLAVTLPFLTRIIVAEIQARRHVKVKIGGVEIQGLSATETQKILTKVLSSKSKPSASQPGTDAFAK